MKVYFLPFFAMLKGMSNLVHNLKFSYLYVCVEKSQKPPTSIFIKCPSIFLVKLESKNIIKN